MSPLARLWAGHVPPGPALAKACLHWPGSGHGTAPLPRVWARRACAPPARGRACLRWSGSEPRPPCSGSGQGMFPLPWLGARHVSFPPARGRACLLWPVSGQGMCPPGPALGKQAMSPLAPGLVPGMSPLPRLCAWGQVSAGPCAGWGPSPKRNYRTRVGVVAPAPSRPLTELATV